MSFRGIPKKEIVFAFNRLTNGSKLPSKKAAQVTGTSSIRASVASMFGLTGLDQTFHLFQSNMNSRREMIN